MAIIGTGTEILMNREKGSHLKSDSTGITINPALTFLLSFSFLKNTKKLLAKNERFSALDTIRLLMIINIHLGHIYQLGCSVGIMAFKKIFSDVYHKALEDNSMVFARSPLPVDVVFTLR